MAPRRQDAIGQSRAAPALLFGKPEERAQLLLIKVNRGSSVAARVITRDLIIYGCDLHGG